MGDVTDISWTDRTFNPWVGCVKVGPGCDNCYAEERDKRYEGGIHWGPGAPRRRTSVQNWNRPRKWNREAQAAGRRDRVFCASLADVFDNDVDPAWRDDLAQLIEQTQHLDWLLLTKRIGNVPDMLFDMFGGAIPPNLRIGATIVTQSEWERDVAKVAKVAVLVGRTNVFLSMEPLLEAVDLNAKYYRWSGIVGWVIVGGESGRHARPMNPEWAIALRNQCVERGVPFHFKQLSQANEPRMYGNPDFFPAELRIREFPA